MHTPLLLTLALASATVQLAAQITVVKPLDPVPPRRLEYHAPQLLSCPATQYPDSLKRRAIGGHVVLDLGDLPEFQREVYAVARSLPRGATMTYGEIAARVGVPGAAQAVGQAMGHNPFPIVVPCHRVVAAGGGNGGFSAPGGVDTKLRLLAIEGATLF